MYSNSFEIFDISVAISDETIVWPGDPPPKITPAKALSKGDSANLSNICMGAHTATHLDAPYHFVENGEKLDTVPLELLVGPARVVDMRGRRSIGRDDLEESLLEGVERVLFKTDNSLLWSDSEFHEDFCHVEPDAAEFLVKSGVALVGIDYLSIEKPHTEEHRTHKTFLDAGVIIIEGCNLTGVPSGDYELICLPLKLIGTEGGPARVILRRPMDV